VITRFGYFTFTADADYTDWSELAYSDNPEMEVKYNKEFKDAYREVIRFRIGGEYVFPMTGLSLRAGYFNDPLPYRNTESFSRDTRQGFSVGLGFLIDQVMMIDVAYVRGNYGDEYVLESSDFNSDIVLTEDIDYNRVYLTASYRF
jgi:long-subunit fatty acid transport protein